MRDVASPDKFVLIPLGAGALKPDSGTETAVVANQRTVTRDGQIAEIVTWVSTCKGKRGSFVMRVGFEHIKPGNGFPHRHRRLEIGSWDGCVRGDHRRGRVANAWVDSDPGP